MTTIKLPPDLYARVLALGVEVDGFCCSAIEAALAGRSYAINQQVIMTPPNDDKTTEPRRGRPMASDTGDKLKWRSVGLEPALWDFVTEAARSSGLTENQFLRQLILRAKTG